jgi:hypothetical protein
MGKCLKKSCLYLKPHCIQSSRVLVPAGTSKSTSRRHSIQAVTKVMAYVADAVTLSLTMRTDQFELASSARTSSTLKWLHRIQCGFKISERFVPKYVAKFGRPQHHQKFQMKTTATATQL